MAAERKGQAFPAHTRQGSGRDLRRAGPPDRRPHVTPPQNKSSGLQLPLGSQVALGVDNVYRVNSGKNGIVKA